MSLKIDQDHSRFKQIVRGKIKANLRQYVQKGEMLGKKGKDTISIPIPFIDIPHFKYGHKEQGGVGQGEGEVGQQLSPGAVAARGRAARPARARATTPSRWTSASRSWRSILGEELAAAQHRAPRQGAGRRPEDQVHRRQHHRPRVAPPLQAHLQAGAAAADRARHLRSGTAGHHPHPRGPALPQLQAAEPAGDQRGHHLHDGRVRLDGGRAEGDRPHRELLARYLAAAPVQGPASPATSSTTRWPARWTARPSSTPASPAAR